MDLLLFLMFLINQVITTSFPPNAVSSSSPFLQYNIKKKEDVDPMMADDCVGRIGATRKKTPEELAKEGEEDDCEFGSICSRFKPD